MRRFWTALAAFSLVEAIGRHPVIASSLMLVGVGGATGVSNFITPSIVPQVTALVNNQNGGAVNNGWTVPSTAFNLKTSDPKSSWFVYFNGTISPALGYNPNEAQAFFGVNVTQNNGLWLSGNPGGVPSWFVQSAPIAGGFSNATWWTS